MYTRVDVLDRGMSHVQGRVDQDSRRFHHVTYNGPSSKAYELFISGFLM